MTDEQKQELKDYRKEYYKKYYIEKKLAIKDTEKKLKFLNILSHIIIKHNV